MGKAPEMKDPKSAQAPVAVNPLKITPAPQFTPQRPMFGQGQANPSQGMMGPQGAKPRYSPEAIDAIAGKQGY